MTDYWAMLVQRVEALQRAGCDLSILAAKDALVFRDRAGNVEKARFEGDPSIDDQRERGLDAISRSWEWLLSYEEPFVDHAVHAQLVGWVEILADVLRGAVTPTSGDLQAVEALLARAKGGAT